MNKVLGLRKNPLKISILSMLLLFGLTSVALAAPWSTVAALTPARGRAVAGVLNDGGTDKLFVVGGWAGYPDLNYCSAYNASLNTWATKAPIPTAGSLACGAVIANQLYVLNYGSFYRYNPANDAWTTITALPPELFSSAAAVAINGKMYVTGGTSDVGTSDRCLEYDPVLNTWTSKAAAPTAREEGTAVAYNGKMYVFGGFNAVYLGGGTIAAPPAENGSGAGINPAAPPDNNYDMTTCEVYDPANNLWSSIAPLPLSRIGPTAQLVNGKIYFTGGEKYVAGVGTLYGSVFEYNPATNTWNTGFADMPTPRRAAVPGVIGNKMYVAGGFSPENGAVSAVEALDISQLPIALSRFSAE